MAKLKVDLVVDDKGKVKLQGVKGEVQEIDKHLHTLSDTAGMVKNALIGAFGAFSVYQVVNFGKECLKSADAIGKLADNLEISTKSLQEYQYAAKLSGVNTEMLNRSFESFAKRLGELRNGTGDLEYKLKDMNVRLMEQLKGAGNTTEALDLLFKAMDKTSNAADRAALAAAAFGRGGVKMVNMIKDGYESFERLREKASALGIVLSDDLIDRAEEINNQFDTMQQIVKTQLTAAFVDMAPALLQVSKAFASMATSIGDLTRHIEKLDGMQTTIRLLYGLAGASVGGLIGGPIGAGIGGGLGLSLGGILSPTGISGEEEDFLKSAWEEALGIKKNQPPKAYIDVQKWMGNLRMNIPHIDEEYLKRWEKTSKAMADTFTDSLINGFDDFAEEARQIFARAFIDQTLSPMINNMMSGIFGPAGILQKTTLPGGASLGDVMGAGALGYGLGGIGGGIGAAGGYMLGEATSLGGPYGMLLGGGIGMMMNEFFGSDDFKWIDQVHAEIKNSITDALAQGFDAFLDSGKITDFEESLKQSLYNIVRESLTQMFAAQAMQPVFDLFSDFLTMSKFVSETGGKDLKIHIPDQFGGGSFTIPAPGIGEAIGQLPAADAIQALFDEITGPGGYWETLADVNQQLLDALGINTEALKSNTDALIGPVEAFLRDLSVGPLAPVQSMEGLQNAYAGLLAQTQNDSGMFGTLAGFARSELLPFAKAYGGDYGSIVEQIKQDVTSLPWYQQAQKTEVSVNVYIGNEEIDARVEKSIKSNPDIRDVIENIAKGISHWF